MGSPDPAHNNSRIETPPPPSRPTDSIVKQPTPFDAFQPPALIRVRVRGAGARHRPEFCPASGRAGLETQLPSSSPPKGRAERQGVSPRPRRHVGEHMAPCAEAHGKQSSLGRSAYACVPHATVLSACNSQRRHALGALTECLASPHCWVLGPPTSSAGHRPFTTLQMARFTARHRTKGPQTRRVRRIPLRAGDAAGTPLCRSGTANQYSLLQNKSRTIFSGNQKDNGSAQTIPGYSDSTNDFQA
jgi:hypothetical protein